MNDTSMLPNLVENITAGVPTAIGRAISIIENESACSPDLVDALYPYLGNAFRLGITGPPGAGKSSLVDRITKEYRNRDKKVGIIGVDPSSPFSGGALLGDRMRMSEHYLDHNVFIRSMATRGATGGLADQCQEVANILDAAGYDVILLETVGVGQVELDVMEAVDTTAVILVPEFGDDIQLMKAGIIEIADIFVINKADREGSGQLHNIINQMLSLNESDGNWQPLVTLTSATKNDGIDELCKAIEAHKAHLENTGILQRKRGRRARQRVENLVKQSTMRAFWSGKRQKLLEKHVDSMPPYELARKILKG